MRSGPRKVTMAGIEWTEQYGVYCAALNGWMELVLSHDNGAYHVRVAGKVLVAKPQAVEDAAILARAKAFSMARGIVDLLKGAE